MKPLPMMILPAMLALGGCGEGADAPPASDSAAPAASSRPAAFAQCVTCHSVEPGKNGIGPSLAGVVGAKAARDPQYAYSTAMRQSGLTWDGATLDRYIKNPRETVQGTKMTYAGLKDDAQRAELIAWLETI